MTRTRPIPVDPAVHPHPGQAQPPSHPQPPASGPAAELFALWKQHIDAPQAAATFPAALGARLRTATADEIVTLLQWVAQNAQDRNRLRRALAGLQEANSLLEAQLARLAEPPHCVARLLAFDAGSDRAVVATGPNARVEVPVHEDVPGDDLVAGADVVLTAERNCVLRVLPAGTAPGAARIVAFRGFVDALPHGELRPARVGDAGGDQLIWVPPALAQRLQSLLGEHREAIRICVDEHGLGFAICGDTDTDPRAAAPRFELPLEPVAATGIVGLAAQRAQVADAVQRVRERGAFVLSQGATGCGKTHLARHALHLLQQLGDTIVLGLRSTPDHRYVGQEESDVEQLFQCARGLAAGGMQVLLFVDELDRHFFRSRYGESVHVNAARATWLAQIGDDLRGILLYGTTNKAGHLPDELLNRVTHPLSFGRLEREQALALLDLHLSADATLPPQRPLVLDAVVAWTHDGLADAAVADVVLRDQTTLALQPSDLRQLSARYLKELALRLSADARSHGPLTPARARAIARARVRDIVQALDLSTHNVAERTFVDFAPRNPPEHVRLRATTPDPVAALFRYRPLEAGDVATR